MKARLVVISAPCALLVPATAAAGKKKDAPAPAAPVETGPATAAPSDSNSQKFLAKLLTTTLKDFRPSDAGGAEFKYSEATFGAGNVFVAKGFVEMDGERMDCTETGTWKMDAAESDKSASVEWTIAKTDCAGRDAGASVRVKMTIDKDGVNTEFR